ncbi:hypothetical protein SAMD00019534_026210 [Acytostelium subglobosum LB1]|uniref:hypothetical protein n=1 Tax=Acytostelium subglobosum LB1 TaxID=1410327 RepID=UPI0006449116|nr:hypothetical protein SAMD00019534_026210 [Acytostelium subglobosum LB1]GAM19446.1 hypothetical protein SAMD00019534_026210 [Acytostelium subglobosum LB1]|eukprot:XP_012757373.1 hypothetical protein SAMD00019534_026210 [Acytostelium subglobosum LB1]
MVDIVLLLLLLLLLVGGELRVGEENGEDNAGEMFSGEVEVDELALGALLNLLLLLLLFPKAPWANMLDADGRSNEDAFGKPWKADEGPLSSSLLASLMLGAAELSLYDGRMDSP